jgi:hypothetical protein
MAILLLGWLIPGAAHVLIGHRAKGIYLGILLLSTFMVGLALGDFRCVNAERHPLSFAGQAGMGLPWLAGWGLANLLAVPYAPPATESLGLLYSSVAALLNLLVVLNAYERVIKSGLEPNSPPSPASAPARPRKSTP